MRITYSCEFLETDQEEKLVLCWFGEARTYYYFLWPDMDCAGEKQAGSLWGTTPSENIQSQHSSCSGDQRQLEKTGGIKCSAGEKFPQIHTKVSQGYGQLWTSAMPQESECQVASAPENLVLPAMLFSSLPHTANSERPNIAALK